jgi:hypothetical protein
MNKPMTFNRFHFAILLNLPFIIYGLITLARLLTGSFNYATDDGYDGRKITELTLLFIIAPVVIVSAICLSLARAHKVKLARIFTTISMAFGVLTTIFTVSMIWGTES